MATPAFADSDGSWTTLSYLRHVFDQFDVRFSTRYLCHMGTAPSLRFVHLCSGYQHDATEIQPSC